MWLVLWVIGYLLGLVTPRSWLIVHMTKAPEVHAEYSFSREGKCSFYSVQIATAKEALDDLNLEIEMPDSIVDHHVVVGGDDVGGVVRVSSIYTIDQDECLIHMLDAESDQTPNITSGVHGLAHGMFFLHAAPLMTSTPIVILFSTKADVQPEHLAGTYTYERFEVPVKRPIAFSMTPPHLFPVTPGKSHTVTITANH